jgi:predicted nucleic acid-binding protein
LIDFISSILKQTSNIHSLKILYIHIEEPFLNIETVCSVIPRSVKHLRISIKNIAEIKTVLEQLNQLISVTFYSANIANYYEDIQKWIHVKRKHSICRESDRCIQIWLGISINNDNEKYSMKKVLQRFYHRQAS